MNSYTLSRQWFDFAFENPDKITVYQGALYMWLIEVNNRGGWAEKFPFNTEDACIATGMNNRKTVWKALNELSELGFVNIVYKSSHRHKPSVISLPIVAQELNGSLDKSIIYQSVQRTSKALVDGQVADQLGNGKRTSKALVNGHSNKPLNNKPLNNKTISAHLFEDSPFIDPELFKQQFTTDDFKGIDLDFYFESMRDWAASKGAKKIDWIATARGFIRRDRAENKVKMKNNFNPGGSNPRNLSMAGMI